MKNRLKCAKSLKRVALLCGAGIAASFVPAAMAAGQGAFGNKPNVVLLFIDDLGYGDIGPYGCKDIPTPNIDKLAETGVVCTSFHVASAPCSPSRHALMMGEYAQRSGKFGMARGQPLPSDRPTMAQFMSDAGYATGQIGKWDLGDSTQGPLSVGFDETRKNAPMKKYSPDELKALEERMVKHGVKNTKALLKKYKQSSRFFVKTPDGKDQWLTDYDGDMMVDFVKRHKDEPFFLYFSPNAVHSPSMEAPESYINRTTAKGVRRFLAGAIVSVDDQVGKLLKVLDEYGLRENTLIVFASDNGANLDEGGSSTPYAGGKHGGTQQVGWVRVPCIYSYPGVIPAGKRYDGLNSSFDFFSTFAVVSGHPVPGNLDGVNMIPHLQGKKTGVAHEFLFQLNCDPSDMAHRNVVAVRWKDWRLYRKSETDQWQLFDLNADPKETKDVSDAHPEVVKRMDEEFGNWRKTLPEWKPIPPRKKRDTPLIPQGYGWASAKEQASGRVPAKEAGNYLTLEAPKQLVAGSTVTVKITHRIPSKLGEQKIHVTLKSGQKKVKRQVLKAKGTGTLDVSFLVPKEYAGKSLNFAAFAGEEYKQRLQKPLPQPLTEPVIVK
ncbi:Arylsulfatase [Pontiella desulfatans]|uniref:Arylsulfatase n=1 Tax=Pontiella desulfatans TaxID=2750659 RepID=A0A6C2U1R7_PONDE|nr:sulfatase-like hydrolase/transferase [Pontiella desulfatans]SPS73878.1 sulfatase S1_19 [Kiritimatiellales bacterium]VGO13920.1 Arylsulfatase [Pontiella desulfatans]